ncbi:MAG: zinc ribbon domain-containing protein [Candidatus Omnitrophica bacterium]|nr:zinc ribbon domain-containing protein [Candidatus Omnitrophota bacterium]
MPTYEYECASCKHKFEVFQNINDKPIESCSKCGKSARRLISAGGGIIFKGSGFYATDYRKPAPQKEGAPGKCPSSSPSCSNCPNA